MQIIDDTSAGGSFGATLGTALGKLAQGKISQLSQQYEKTQYAKSLAPLLGNDTANFLSNLGPDERKGALDNIGYLLQLNQQPGSQQQGGGMAALGGIQQQQSGQNPRDVIGAIANMIGKTPEEALGEIQKNPELQRVFSEAVGMSSPQQQQPQQQVQMRPGNNQQQMTPERAQLIQNLFTSPKDRIARETLDLKKSAAAQKEQASLEPFLKERFQNYNADKRIKRIAYGMLQNIEKHKDKFPGRFTGNLPEKVQDIVIRDPNVRKYMADTNSLVKLLANSDTRGQITNAKLKLEQLAKANVGMPIETQIEILKGIVQGVDRSERSIKYMEKLKNKGTGRYPVDLPSKLVEYDLAQEDPLSYPQYYTPGTEYTDDNGAVYVNMNGKEWVKKGV